MTMQDDMFRDQFNKLMWTCHICKEEREDKHISVHTKPLRGIDGTFSRSIAENVRHCNDRPDCIRAAKSFSFVRTWGAGTSE